MKYLTKVMKNRLVNKKNVMDIVRRLMQHVESAEGSSYRDELLARIIQICSHNNYQYISNFEWYVSVLVELTRVEGTHHGALISSQLLDVAVRVQSIRHLAVSSSRLVQQMSLLLRNAHLLLHGSAQHRSNVCEVLTAAAFICGEYAEHLEDTQGTLEAMLKTKPSAMPGHIQAVYLQNVGKLYSRLLCEFESADDWDALESLDNLLTSKLPQFEQTDDLEAQERACSLLQLVKVVEGVHSSREKIGGQVQALFEGELNPVAVKAQRKVPVPEGLDLDAWINEPIESEKDSSEESDIESDRESKHKNRPGNLPFGSNNHAEEVEKKEGYEPTAKELKEARNARLNEQKDNPYYMKSTPTKDDQSKVKQRKKHRKHHKDGDSATLPATVELDLKSPLQIPGTVGLKSYLELQESTVGWKKRSKKKGKKRRDRSSSAEEAETVIEHQVNRDAGEMPEGAASSEEEEDKSRQLDLPSTDQHGLPTVHSLDIDLDTPLRDDEFLPAPQVYALKTDVPRVAKLKDSNVKAEKDTVKKSKESKKTKKEKKEKKSKKSKKDSIDEQEPNLLEVSENGPEPDDKPAGNGLKDKTEAEATVARETPEIEFDQWMNDMTTSKGGLTEDTQINGDIKDKHVHEKEHTKEKKKKLKSTSSDHRKGRKKEHKSHVKVADDAKEAALTLEPGHDKSEYEQASGADTPSASTPQRPLGSSPAPPLQAPARLHLLAENKHLRLTYESSASAMSRDRVQLRVVLCNVSDTHSVKGMEWSTIDSLNVKLCAQLGTEDSIVSVPFSLAPGTQNALELQYTVDILTCAHKLRGSLIYQTVISSDSSQGPTPEKLDFNLRLPCVTFTHAPMIDKESFADALSNGDLVAKQTVECAHNDTLATLIARISHHAHATVVEQLDQSVSFYTETIQAQPVCILIKLKGNSMLSIDGKSSDAGLLTNVMDELQQIVLGKFEY